MQLTFVELGTTGLAAPPRDDTLQWTFGYQTTADFGTIQMTPGLIVLNITVSSAAESRPCACKRDLFW